MRRSSGLVTNAVTAILVAHVVVTALDNLPDAKVSLGMRFPIFRKIPQWKFFAPNPGIENLHIMYRTGESGRWSLWSELVVAHKRSPLSAIWNPGSRASKALFDAAHQLRILAGFGSSFEWATSSDAYAIVRDVVRARCGAEDTDGDFQFMILASVPREGDDGMKPILVSSAEPVALPKMAEKQLTWM